MCLFCDIVEGKVSCTKVYEDEHLLAFKDLYPQAKKHILLVPKKHIESLATINESEIFLISEMFLAVKKIVKDEGIIKKGFRTVFNCNQEGAQSIYHLHLHILGGEQLGGNMSGL